MPCPGCVVKKKKNKLCLSNNREIPLPLERPVFCILAKTWLSFFINTASVISKEINDE